MPLRGLKKNHFWKRGEASKKNLQTISEERDLETLLDDIRKRKTVDVLDRAGKRENFEIERRIKPYE